ncbi:MAG: histidine kinase [Eubacterium sp.]|nr:histidine kinase [Eubacterium sp.]
MKHRKKRNRLLLQLGLVFLTILTVLLTITSLGIYDTAVTGFLEGQNANMTSALEEITTIISASVYDSPVIFEFCLDEWKKDPEYFIAEANPEEQIALIDYLENTAIDGSFDQADFYEKELPDQYKPVFAKTTYDDMSYSFSDFLSRLPYERFVFYDLSNPESVFVYGEYGEDGLIRNVGQRFEVRLEEHPAIADMISTPSEEIRFERSSDIPEKGSYYIGYRPFVVDGKVRAALGLVYDWDNFRNSLRDKILRRQLLTAGCVLLGMILFLFVLYRKAVRPISQIEEGIQSYSADKSSPRLVGRMYQIKTNNEVEYLADSLADLSCELDFYTRENVRIAEEREKTKKELYEAKVNVMVSQIQPHFMYNALTSIAMMCTIDPETAQEATVTFADYLRGNMDSLKQTAPVPFEMELEHLKKYLYIEQLRFGKKLQVEYDLPVMNFRVPMLSIQPLVENAVKHGVGMKKKGGTVEISTRETDTAYQVIIRDDGVGFDPDAKKEPDGRSHVGMENTRKRLMDLCGAGIITESVIGEGTTVTITLPKDVQEGLE